MVSSVRHGPYTRHLVSGQTQDALYAEIDLDLSWSEAELPQVQRTKHVHGLHPYLGKFVPQLVDVFLNRYFKRGGRVYDPFVGSGTTLVEANVFGADAVGCDVSAFNCLLSRVKTTEYSVAGLEMALRSALEETRQNGPASTADASDWLKRWYAPQALGELLRYREITVERLDDPEWDVAKVILSRAARSARLTTHFDLDFPRSPTTAAYHCHKHKRTCVPVEEAMKFLMRYTSDTVARLRVFASQRTGRSVHVVHEDSRTVDLPARPDGIITSPPYPGLIDYHEQHRYAYELIGLHDRRDEEIGPAVRGTSRAAIDDYVVKMTEVFLTSRRQMRRGTPIIIVVNDSRGLYPLILAESGLALEQTLTRHVNRRTGRRAGEFFESVLVCSTR
jgi:hypothetical protein